MVAWDKEYNAELFELQSQEGEEVVFVRYNVANVTKQRQVGCRWDNFEDIVCFWRLQMQVGESAAP